MLKPGHGSLEELPAVILANHGEKDANFLDINILREATSSQDTGYVSICFMFCHVV
jgi:hypothetical protein